MALEAMVQAPNSVVLVLGDMEAAVPESMRGSLVAATAECVAVGTLTEHDGVARLRLLDVSELGSAELPPLLVFEGEIATPGRTLAIASVFGDVYLELPTAGGVVALQVWVSDTSEPDDIAVIVRDLPSR